MCVCVCVCVCVCAAAADTVAATIQMLLLRMWKKAKPFSYALSFLWCSQAAHPAETGVVGEDESAWMAKN